MLAAVAAVAVLAGCTAVGQEPETGGGTVTVGTITHTPPPSATITRTVTAPPSSGPGTDQTGSDPTQAPAPGSATPPGPASSEGVESPQNGVPTTNEPAATAASCPYLSDNDAARMIGQRAGQTMLIEVEPAPICLFYRNDGGWMGAIRPIRTATAEQAVAAVDAHIPRADSSPADDPDGWSGGYMQLPDGAADYPAAESVYGVSKETLAIVVWTNQEQTVKGRRIAETAIGALGW